MNIYGASGHAKVIINLVHSRMLEIHNIIDDNASITGIYDYPVVHEVTPEILKRKTIIAVGDNRVRKKISSMLKENFYSGVSHADAVVDETVEMGVGTVIMASATINADAILGKHCILNTGCVVEHDCLLEDFVHVSPGAILAGGARIGEGTHIGIGALIIPGIKIGKWCTIGAGAVIIEDVPDNATVVGNPGRVIKILSKEDE
ncbi:acetyltransferase [Salinimicrobium tongyeongense]|uniref:Acetyltransferase n=1 Tax=Salinimicrobium tongyeongense TaxID=2809707 RepID=A0ABY6NSN4_9FLAO|nr:acetyltransferase [Salinimicrobium tongyeongense]UZH55498.1 acetyltransferase [Salinimicrobium tongyeongense]